MQLYFATYDLLKILLLFRIFHILKIDKIMPFCDSLMERPSYKYNRDVWSKIQNTHIKMYYRIQNITKYTL